MRKKKRKAILRKEERLQKPINDTDRLPMTKAEIQRLYKEDSVRGFHMHRCKNCHGQTNFEQWLNPNTSAPYRLNYHKSYEPYILIKRAGVPRYDARFRGYGWNKIVHILQLEMIYKVHWVVASDLFIFHMPHGSSTESKAYFKARDSSGWLAGLSRLCVRDLRRHNDQTGYIME